MGTDRLIYIRTDANGQIALGHLMRCLAVAWACRELHMEVCFLLSDKESAENFLSKQPRKPFPFLILETAAYDDPERELPELLALLRDRRLPGNASLGIHDRVLFLDSYFVTDKYMQALKSVIPLAYLDDLRRFDYPADLIVNYDVIPEDELPIYQASYQNAGKLLLGAAYAPLRNEFTVYDTCVRNEIGNILVTTGGSDPCHFCTGLLSRLLQMKSSGKMPALLGRLTWQIVVGSMNTDAPELFRLWEGLSAAGISVVLRENVSQMSALMKDCDVALSAAGTTLYELCALGIPAISFILADNQKTCARAFEKTGMISCAGDLRQPSHQVYDNVFSFLQEISPFEKRQAVSLKMRSAVNGIDGKGALRIAQALSEL